MRQIHNHKLWTNWVKKELGSKCTFVSFIHRKDEEQNVYVVLNIKVKNALGGRDNYNIPIQKPISHLQSSDYKDFVREARNLILQNEEQDAGVGTKS